MRDYWRFVCLCLSRAWRHKWHFWDFLSGATAALPAFAMWMWPNWFTPQTIQTMSEVSNWFYSTLALGIVVLWRLLMSPFWVYQDMKLKAAIDLEEARKEASWAASQATDLAKKREMQLAKALVDEQEKVANLNQQRLNRRDKVMLDCADLLKRGETFLQALQGSKADELETNEDLIEVCRVLVQAGHRSPFTAPGVLESIPETGWLAILRDMRLRGIGWEELPVLDYLISLLNQTEATEKTAVAAATISKSSGAAVASPFFEEQPETPAAAPPLA